MGLTGNENLDLVLITVITIWSMLAKGVALWRSATLKQRNWFIVMLIINSVGIIELIYLFRFATKRLTLKEVKSWINNLRKKD